MNLDSSVAAAAAEACEVPVQECAVVRRRMNLDSSVVAAAAAAAVRHSGPHCFAGATIRSSAVAVAVAVLGVAAHRA
jgi:hypothetical protein